ncbi:MAG: polyprenol monophosphomannose synthase [Chloroflexi bacterium]|nr:polyprenol monophosphomannose synthase [Chloroflexota bacterium]
MTVGQRDSLVIVPTYNEVGNLGRLVPIIVEQGPFDVLVIDDNSPDGTGELAEQLAREYPGWVHVVHRTGKLGLGSAYVRGFTYALANGYTHVFEMDADFSHDPEDLPELRRALLNTDVVLGSRYVAGGSTRHWPFLRRFISQAGSRYAGLVLGLPFRDLTGGFKGFSRRALAALDLDAIRSNGYSFQIEVTYRLHQQGFRIVEHPIVFEDRRVGTSKMNRRILSEAFLMVWKLRLSRAAPRALGEAQA